MKLHPAMRRRRMQTASSSTGSGTRLQGATEEDMKALHAFWPGAENWFKGRSNWFTQEADKGEQSDFGDDAPDIAPEVVGLPLTRVWCDQEGQRHWALVTEVRPEERYADEEAKTAVVTHPAVVTQQASISRERYADHRHPAVVTHRRMAQQHQQEMFAKAHSHQAKAKTVQDQGQASRPPGSWPQEGEAEEAGREGGE